MPPDLLTEEFHDREYAWVADVLAVAVRVIARKADDGPGLASVLGRLEKLSAISWN